MMLAGMTTCSRMSVQVRLSVEGVFSITGKCKDALFGHPKDGHTRFSLIWQAFFPREFSRTARKSTASFIIKLRRWLQEAPQTLSPESALQTEADSRRTLSQRLKQPKKIDTSGKDR